MAGGPREGGKVCQNPWEAREGLRWTQWHLDVRRHEHGRFFLSPGRYGDEVHYGRTRKKLTLLTADCQSQPDQAKGHPELVAFLITVTKYSEK